MSIADAVAPTRRKAGRPRAKVVQVELPPEGELGPCMRALDARRRKFVIAYCNGDGRTASAAARAAGYAERGNGAALKVTAHRIIHSPDVLRALREEADRRLSGGAYAAASALVEIATDPLHRDRYKAAADILDRRGFLRVMGHEMQVEHRVDRRGYEQLMELVRDKLVAHGVAALPAPGVEQKVVDAEFSEVDKASVEQTVSYGEGLVSDQEGESGEEPEEQANAGPRV